MNDFSLAMSFDDVLLVPRKSSVSSRANVDISSSIADNEFTLPIISSPMDTVTGQSMAKTMHKQGGVFLLCIDVAHGHHTNVERALKTLKDKFGNKVSIMAGNVATAEGFADLEDWGADAIRVGVGGGSICSTRLQTGHGIPTFHSVLVAGRARKTAKLIADGGIRTAGDAVKSLAAGADFVMLGSMLSGTDDTPGEVFNDTSGGKYKIYRGMASVEAQVAWRGKASSLEGVSTTVAYKGSAAKILSNLDQNIRSGLSYNGAHNLMELQEAPAFIRQTSAGMRESATHILSK